MKETFSCKKKNVNLGFDNELFMLRVIRHKNREVDA